MREVKEKLQARKDALNQKKADLFAKTKESSDATELKSITDQLISINEEITSFDELLKLAELTPPADEDERTKHVNNREGANLIGTSADFIQGQGFIPASEGRWAQFDGEFEKRDVLGKTLKNIRADEHVESPFSIFGELRTIAVGSGSSIVVPNYYSNEIVSDFPVVSSLIDSVEHLTLDGGDSFRQPYIIGIGGGSYTGEGQEAWEAETEFDYVDIERTKITAYAELTKELFKMPNAAYADVAFQNIRTSMRKTLSREIMVGDGSKNHITGIFSAGATAIDPTTDYGISAITDTTLDEILFQYGGDEEVEAPAVLILNKFDLLAFSKVRTSTKQKFYDIKLNGNGGNINGVPFIINSACKALTASNTGVGEYCMAYGNLSSYLLCEFSRTEVSRSDDYKFRKGMTCYLGECYFGGNVIKKNGFLRIVKKSSS